MAQETKKRNGPKSCMVQWLNTACSSLTHASALQPQFTPSLWLVRFGGTQTSHCWAFPKHGSSQTHQPCTSSHFPLKAHSRTHTAFCKAGIPNLSVLLFSMYNEDYGLNPASQGGAVGIERVKAVRQHCSRAITNPSTEGDRKNPMLFAVCLRLASASINWEAIFSPVQI